MPTVYSGDDSDHGAAFGTNVDSLHILWDRPWGASHKMLCSLAEAVVAEPSFHTVGDPFVLRHGGVAKKGIKKEPQRGRRSTHNFSSISSRPPGRQGNWGGWAVERRELLAPSKPCPHPGAARGPEVPVVSYGIAPRPSAGAARRSFFFQVGSRLLQPSSG